MFACGCLADFVYLLLLLLWLCSCFFMVGVCGIGGGRELGLGRSGYVSVCWRASVAVCACLSWCRRSDRRACLAALLAVAVAEAMVEAVAAVVAAAATATEL